MCRLLLASYDAIMEYTHREHKSGGIPGLLDHLECELGGHGNGVCLLKGNKIVYSKKGRHYTTTDAAHDIMDRGNYDYALFHTRLTSLGANSSVNCHPFIQRNNALAMNGTEYALAGISKATGITDTKLIFKMILGLDQYDMIKALSSFRSVFVGFVKGSPYVVKNYGALVRYRKLDFFVSSLPKGVKAQQLKGKYTWLDGHENVIPDPVEIQPVWKQGNSVIKHRDDDDYDIEDALGTLHFDDNDVPYVPTGYRLNHV